MSTVYLKGKAVQTAGSMPVVGSVAPNFDLVQADLSPLQLAQFKGKRVLLNIFPSIDTGVCAASVRMFNKRAAAFSNTIVICISKDLPFALGRFCGAEGIEDVVTASAFRAPHFGQEYGVLMTDGPLAGLLARSVVVINETGEVIYTELVSEITSEPNYEEALKSLM